MIFNPYYHFETGCAAYLLGYGGLAKCAVVDAHEGDLEAYVAFAAGKDMRITFTRSCSRCPTRSRSTPDTSRGRLAERA